VSRAASTPRAGLALGVGLATAWYAWILLGFDPLPPPEPRARARPVPVTYMPVEAAGMPDRPDVRAIWSPVLFSLPTAVGFSRGVPSGPVARPPLDPPADPPPLLALRTQTPVQTAVPLAPVPLPAFVPPPPPPPAPAGTTMTPLEGTVPPDAGFPVASGACGDRSWEAEAQVAFGGDGLPLHAFVESADAPPGVRREIARGLHRWRRSAGGAAGWVRVRLVHSGTAPAEVKP